MSELLAHLKAQMQATARDVPPPSDEANDWMLSLDTLGGPKKWIKTSLFVAWSDESLRCRGISPMPRDSTSSL